MKKFFSVLILIFMFNSIYSQIITITSDLHYRAQINQSPLDKIVIVFFSAKWSGPSNHYTTILDNYKTQNPDLVTILKCDVDDLPELASENIIQLIPTTLFIKNSQIKERVEGIINNQRINEIVYRYIE